MTLVVTNLGDSQQAVERALADMEEARTLSRIWIKDHTVWKPAPTEITNRLGWLHIAEEMKERLPALRQLAEKSLDDGFSDVVLLGMGGSSLAADVFSRTFSSPGLRLSVLDSTSPGAVLASAQSHDLSRALFIVATKSGGTAETLSLFKFFYNRVSEMVGAEKVGEHFIAITDPGSRLTGLAGRLRFRETLLNNPDIGGRYSVLSHFGLAPAALMGVDVSLLLDRAIEMADACSPEVATVENPAARLGVVMGQLALNGRDKITFALSPGIASFGDWVEQLIAESLGKDGRSILPVVGEDIGSPEVYGNDRAFAYLRLEDDTTYDDQIQTLESAGHPVIRLSLRDIYDLGQQFFLWELATAVAGEQLGVNPFDQPDVEAAKVLARKMIAEYTEKGELPASTSVPPSAEPLHNFLAAAEPVDYIAIQAYLPPAAETDTALNTLRLQLRDRYHLATTVGYGPRFLHSTGQLHKGDAGNGLFIQFITDVDEDGPIPDEAGTSESAISFGVLIGAQALGDWQALLDANRRIIRFDLGTDVAKGLAALLKPRLHHVSVNPQ